MQSQLVYGNFATRRPSGSVTGDTYTFAPLFVGQQIKLSLRFLDRVNDAVAEIFPKVRAVRASIGRIDARPDSGTVRIQIGLGFSDAANTIPAINWNESANEIKTRLNALSSVSPKDFDVIEDNGSYFVRRGSGDAFELTVRENVLQPVSFVRKREWIDERGHVCELRFIQSPVAFTSSASQVLPPKPKIVTLEDGVTDLSGTFRRNEKQRLTIPRTFRGQFFLEKGVLKSALLNPNSGIAQIKAAAESLFAPEGGGTVTVTNPETRVADLVFSGELAGIDVPQLGVGVPLEGTPPGDWTIILDLNKVETWACVRKSDEISLPFELEIEVPEDEDDDDSASKVVKLWVENVTLRRPVNWEGLETAQSLNWLSKPNPKTYLPYNETQYALGELAYQSLAFGDGSEIHFAFNHNLGSLALTGLRVINLLDGRVLRDSEYEALVTNAGNTLELNFTAAPAASSLRVFLAVPQTIEMFLADLQIDIANVDGLQDILNDHGSRLAAIEAIFPTTGAPATQASGVGIVFQLPTTAKVMFLRDWPSPWGEKGLDKSKLPTRFQILPPPLLPAVHSDSTSTTADPDLDPATITGQLKVYTGTSTEVISPGGGLPSSRISTGEIYSSNGERNFKVSKGYGTNSYYPDAYIEDIFPIAVSESMFKVNKTFDLRIGVEVQIVDAPCKAQWVFELRLGKALRETSPGPLGLNLESILWADVPAIEEPILVTSEPTQHYFGVRIKRLASSFVLDRMLYGDWLPYNAAAPTSASFLVGGRFTSFDTENNAVAPRGWLAYRIIGSISTDSTGNQTIVPAKAVIS